MKKWIILLLFVLGNVTTVHTAFCVDNEEDAHIEEDCSGDLFPTGYIQVVKMRKKVIPTEYYTVTECIDRTRYQSLYKDMQYLRPEIIVYEPYTVYEKIVKKGNEIQEAENG